MSMSLCIKAFRERYKHPDGKFLIIGGGIANFTDVAATFTGLIKALQEYADDIKERRSIHIYRFMRCRPM